MSVTYPDLNINFPDTFDVLKFFRDLTITEKPIVLQINQLNDQGRFEEADALLDANPKLKECFPTAADWNRNLEICIALERFFRDNVQDYIINAIRYKGNYSPTTQYKVYNLIYYKTTDPEMGTTIDAYVAYKDNIPVGTLPTDKNYFFPVTQRGQMGASGVGYAFRQEYDYSKQYYTDDVVLKDNTLWYAKQDNINSTPVEGSLNWGIYFKLKQESSAIIMIDGRPLSEGLVCAAFDNPVLIKDAFLTEATITGGYFYELRFTSTNKLIADATGTKSGEDYITTIRIYKVDGITIDKTVIKTETKVNGVYKTIIS